MAKKFNGVVNIDVRDSVPDWTPFRESPAPEGAPNVLVVLYDDTGLAAWSPYGGRINMPTCRSSPTTASPTRSGTPPRCARRPGRACSPDATTTRTGSPRSPRGPRASRATPVTSRWRTRPSGRCSARTATTPTGSARTTTCRSTSGRWAPPAATGRWRAGFDRYYGFIGGETNNWYPTLVEDNHYIDQPYLPEEGYHLSKDLADKAISYIARQQDVRAEEALVPVVLPGCQPRAAPRAARSTSPSTRGSSTTATRPTASGCCRGWSSAGSCPRARRSPTSTRCRATPRWRWTTSSRGRRSATTRSGSSPASPRCTPASRSTPTRRSAGSSTTSRRPASSTTRS